MTTERLAQIKHDLKVAAEKANIPYREGETAYLLGEEVLSLRRALEHAENERDALIAVTVAARDVLRQMSQRAIEAVRDR